MYIFDEPQKHLSGVEDDFVETGEEINTQITVFPINNIFACLYVYLLEGVVATVDREGKLRQEVRFLYLHPSATALP